MGGCLSNSFEVNTRHEVHLKCIEPFVFSVSDAETVLMESEMGDYLLYRDHITCQIVLSVRNESKIRHHRISEQDGLFYLHGQPYPYIDSIILYHRKHRLDTLRLNKQAQLSARIIRLFTQKVARSNGNSPHTLNQESAGQQGIVSEYDNVPTFHSTNDELANATTTDVPQTRQHQQHLFIDMDIHANTNNHIDCTGAKQDSIQIGKNATISDNLNLSWSNESGDVAGVEIQSPIYLSSWTPLHQPGHRLTTSNVSSSAPLLPEALSTSSIFIERL